MDLESEAKLISLITQMFPLDSDPSPSPPFPELISILTRIIFLVSSMDFNSQPKPLSKLMFLTFETILVFHSMDLDSQPEPLRKLISHIFSKIEFLSLVDETLSLEPEPELVTLIGQILFLVNSKPQWELEPESEPESEHEHESEQKQEQELEPGPGPGPRPEPESGQEQEPELGLGPGPEPETELISLISQLISIHDSTDAEFIPLSIEIICLVNSMDIDSQPKPESELMSLIAQTISLVNSMDLDSLPKTLSKLISLISQQISLGNYIDSNPDWDAEDVIISLVFGTLKLEPEPELISRMRQIFFVGIFMDSKWNKLISICPQVQVRLEEGKFHVTEEEEVSWRSNNKWKCLPLNWERFRLSGGKDPTHFFCRDCNGKNHEEYDKAPVEIKQPLHLEHSLRLVLLQAYSRTMKCYCCDEDLKGAIYYCATCDFAINFSCAKKPPILSINHPKWHEHPLFMFPRRASLTCNLCSLADSSSPIYMCPNCDIVVHLRCMNLPHVIRISRHLHRISFTPSFDLGDWCCGVCRKKIEKYGGYSCIKDGCSYAAHSRCATQSNMWDGKELEGEPEEIEEEEVESFVRIDDGIIQHFSHQHHHLRLDENTSRNYDEYKLCQACITPIYFGNFYSCMQCDFILHEKCAKLSRKIHHPIHPHLLTLVGRSNDVIDYFKDNCSACPWMCKTGFFYKCGEERCYFQLHVQCATISEPLVHESHIHPLFLTSKPGEEKKICSVCQGLKFVPNSTNETFNCIECDFVLCFECATLPQKVRYKHDKHMLTLSYGEDTSSMTYWCEGCEGEIYPKNRFYKCDEYCCVTLHIECLLGRDLYMKPGSSWSYLYDNDQVYVFPNNHMSRPVCYFCKKRCPHKIFFQYSGLILCSTFCYHDMRFSQRQHDYDQIA